MSAATDRNPMLLGAGRQSVIVEYLQAHGSVRVRELAQSLGVSEMTIRRDIDALDDSGAVEKIHGGAKLPGNLSHDEPGFEKKQLRQGPEKQAIAEEAAKQVVSGMVVGLSAGTTTYALAKRLREIPGLTIVTNSILVADQFERAPGKQKYSGSVLVTGGERTPSDAFVGPIAVSSLRQLHVDILFLGVHGVQESAGLTTPNLLESELDQVFIAAANRVAVVADHTKWGTVGMSTIAPLEAAQVFITDAGLDLGAQAVLRERVGSLIVAAAPE
jgi:DeoR family fructose operon transcriptional repressor